jgi:hypothetical protein
MSLTPYELKQEIAITALNNMLRKSFFSICEVRDAANLLGIPANGEAYDTLKALHCVDYANMSPAVRQAIPQLISEVFNRPDIFQFQLPSQRNILEPARATIVDVKATVVSPKAKPRTMIGRLLGRS